METRGNSGGTYRQVSVSIGVATIGPRPTLGPTRLLELADRALYRAKEGGRNRVALHEPGAEESPRP